MRAVLLGVMVVALIALAVEGAWHATTGRSLLDERPAQPAEVDPADAADAEQLGLYQRHPDPRVGYVLAPSTTMTLLESTFTTDEHGMRRRAQRVPPGAAVIHILVVGDSVAFGFGVDDDECLAHALETLLDDERVRGAAGRRVMCSTIAVPSWNHESPRAYLAHHIDRLDPDIVLYLPVHNDLADTSGVTSRGTRREEPVIHSPEPLIEIAVGRSVQLVRAAEERARAEGVPLDDHDLGVDALMSDVCATSRRKYAEAAASVQALRVLVEERGARLALLRTGASPFGGLLDDHLAQLDEATAALVPAAMGLMRATLARFTLGYDPHPNAETLSVWATWIARDLAERGWVDSQKSPPWPSVASEYTAQRRAILSIEQTRTRAELHRAEVAGDFLPEIDFQSGRGIQQVLGGCNPNGTARTGLAVALPEPALGGVLLVVAAPIENRPDLYPLDVEVRWRGQSLGTLTIPADSLGRFNAELPERPDDDLYGIGEVELLPADWVVARADSRVLVASFQPLRIAIVDP